MGLGLFLRSELFNELLPFFPLGDEMDGSRNDNDLNQH